jgi:hypothetical protein
LISSHRELLAPVYGWFTEGFDTLDLKEAKVAGGVGGVAFLHEHDRTSYDAATTRRYQWLKKPEN